MLFKCTTKANVEMFVAYIDLKTTQPILTKALEIVLRDIKKVYGIVWTMLENISYVISNPPQADSLSQSN